MPEGFHHERLEVYQMLLRFLGWLAPLVEEVRKQGSTKAREVTKRLDRSSLSALLNVAEGNGKRQRQIRARFFDDARGAATECAACLDALVAKRICDVRQTADGKAMLCRAAQMLTKLVQRYSEADGVRESEAEYDTAGERNCVFDHEKLEVYQLELSFVRWVTELLAEVKDADPSESREIRDHLDRASLSALLKTALANGKRRGRARAEAFDIARGSSTECAACLDALAAKDICSVGRIGEGKQMLVRIVQMLSKLVQRFSGDMTIAEGGVAYGYCEAQAVEEDGEEDDEFDDEDGYLL